MVRGFWNSPVGREIRWRQRWLRTRRLWIDGEPERKGRRGGSARTVGIQRLLVEQLEELGYPVLRGPVALDLAFDVTSRQPPAVHHLAKYLLDALGPIRADNADRDRQHVMYRDDRQVKLLYAHLYHPWTTDPEATKTSRGQTWIEARPLRDVVEDLRLASDLLNQTRDEDSPFYIPEIPEPQPELTFNPEREASPEQTQHWSDLQKWLTVHDRSHMQETLLQRTDAHIASIVQRSVFEISGAHPRRDFPSTDPSVSAMFDEIRQHDRHALLSGPLTAPMPGLPQVSGEGQTFIDALRQHLEQMRARWPVFDPLLVPIKIIFLVVPPQQGKDLDNIAQKTLPHIHDILAPPLVPPLIRDLPPPGDSWPENQRAQGRLRYIRTNSITAYEVIELKRQQNDPPEGHLRIALGSSKPTGSTWSQIAAYTENLI